MERAALLVIDAQNEMFDEANPVLQMVRTAWKSSIFN